jgi:probable rRNA maturation factor
MITTAVFRDVSLSIPLTNHDIVYIVSHVCKREKVKNAELSIVIVHDRKIRTINKDFLGHDKVTDVITFPLEDEPISAEIYINAQQAKRQARQYKVSYKNEMTRLIIHGTLHAVGYNDETENSRKKMTGVQEQYVTELS